ncbi:MAG: Ig-like domain-containing protein [Solirubrobacteraceae bacterium]
MNSPTITLGEPVFIDWQNAYQQARAAFGLVGSGHEGQFSPLRLAQLLAARNRRGKDSRLVRVEVHRGQPLSSIDPIGHAAVADTNAGTVSTPAGTVGFSSNGTGSFSASTCTLAEVSVGVASCTVSYTPSAIGTGTHKITGSYAGNATHATSSESTSVTVT